VYPEPLRNAVRGWWAGAAGQPGLMLVTGFALGLASGVGLTRVLSPPSHRSVPGVAAEVPRVPSAAVPFAEPNPTPAAVPATSRPGSPVSSSPARVPAGREGSVTAPAATGDHSLAEEIACLRRAQSALSADRTAEALAALDDCDRRFPGGRLPEERDLLRVQALANASRIDEARKLAEQFEATHPNSLLIPRLRRIRSTLGP
jgi:hypothetical protein